MPTSGRACAACAFWSRARRSSSGGIARARPLGSTTCLEEDGRSPSQQWLHCLHPQPAHATTPSARSEQPSDGCTRIPPGHCTHKASKRQTHRNRPRARAWQPGNPSPCGLLPWHGSRPVGPPNFEAAAPLRLQRPSPSSQHLPDPQAAASKSNRSSARGQRQSSRSLPGSLRLMRPALLSLALFVEAQLGL